MTEPPPSTPLSVATWNMDYWKRKVAARERAWRFLGDGLSADVALLQECVPPSEMRPSRVVYREIGWGRPWGSAVWVAGDDLRVREVGAVRTRYGSTRFPMLGTRPGTVVVSGVTVPELGSITCVSVYGMIDYNYAQTTMLRIVADLIPLFDSPVGEHVVLGGDFNLTTAVHPSTPEFARYEAILGAVESLGLRNLVETADERPPQFEGCPCGTSACHHLRTYGGNPGAQLDWLPATPELERRCRRLEVVEAPDLSDHAALVEIIAWTVSLRSSGRLTVQFQYVSQPLFDEDAVDQMVRHFEARDGT